MFFFSFSTTRMWKGGAQEVVGFSVSGPASKLTRGLLQDEMKLIRLRTKKQELVVVPNPKYLLIVVHDTPPA